LTIAGLQRAPSCSLRPGNAVEGGQGLGRGLGRAAKAAKDVIADKNGPLTGTADVR